MSLLRRILLVLVLIVSLFAAISPRLSAGCIAWNGCGAWCETFGSCSHEEHCRLFSDGVFCQCGNTLAYFYCDGDSDISYN